MNLPMRVRGERVKSNFLLPCPFYHGATGSCWPHFGEVFLLSTAWWRTSLTGVPASLASKFSYHTHHPGSVTLWLQVLVLAFLLCLTLLVHCSLPGAGPPLTRKYSFVHTGSKDKCNQAKSHLFSLFKFYVFLKVCGSGIHWAEIGKSIPLSSAYTLSETQSLNHNPLLDFCFV